MRLILGMLLILSSAFITANDLLNQKVLAGDDLEDAQQAKNKLDSRIQPPDLRKYEDIRDGNDWLNPYLVIRPEGIQLIARGSSVERKVISRHELKKMLISLPVTAWPYGRVIGVQEIGIRSGSPNSEIWRKDDELIEKNKIEVNRVLSSLGVRIKWWPSN
jgi:hypothetical protein